jgi:putative tryptophan/tyrosine transport system substrate-binding protein
MNRRAFVSALGTAALAWPLAARAQQPARMKRVAFVIGLDDHTEGRARFAAFRQGLEALGWTEGRNIEIVARFGTADPDRNRTVVAELLNLAPDVIVTSNTITVSALMRESRTIPIVLANMSDPVAQGFAESLARPGGNVTGFTSFFEGAIATKWLELLREIAPGMIRVAVLIDPQETTGPIFVSALEAATASLGIQLTTARVRDDAEIERAVEAFARVPNGGLIVPPGPRVATRRAVILKLAGRRRLPAIYGFPYIVREGGLMSYGPDVIDLYRRPASYVDRILKGAKPADLPIQQPTKFELVVNLKTAKALGLEVPLHLQQLADEVIE